MTKNVIVLLADGFEEVEAVTPIDYLRRAGIAVTVAAVGGSPAVKGARGITVNADLTLRELIARQQGASFDAGAFDAGAFDALVIPGGMPGAANIADSPEAGALITQMAAAGKWVCAICAAPVVVLAPLGLLAGKKFSCYPGMEETVKDGIWTGEAVVVDSAGINGGIITSRAAGTAGVFAIAIIKELLGQGAGDAVDRSVLLTHGS